jgi:hypothetical protein
MVPALDGFLTEIRTFYSLKEIREGIEAQINQYKILYEDYSQWLGSLLRNPESSKKPEWAKKTAELQRILKTGGTRKGPKKEDKKTGISTEWTQFKDLMLCAEELGEAEILFEATEELRSKVDKLEKAKDTVVDLERYGLGKDLLLVTYIHEGVPERIVFKPKKTAEVEEKFEFVADFSMAKEAQR